MTIQEHVDKAERWLVAAEALWEQLNKPMPPTADEDAAAKKLMSVQTLTLQMAQAHASLATVLLMQHQAPAVKPPAGA